MFEPLGMPDTGFHVPAEKASRLVTQHNRSPLGDIVEQPFVAPDPPATFSGGGGLSSTARDYARFLRLILNGGELDGVQVLGPEAMAGLTNGHSGDHAAGLWATAQQAFSCDTDFSHGGTARHSLGFVLSTEDSPGARSAGSLSWGGIFNTYYWIDPARGLAGATQFLPFADPTALAIFDAFEREVYATFG